MFDCVLDTCLQRRLNKKLDSLIEMFVKNTNKNVKSNPWQIKNELTGCSIFAKQ